MRPTCRLCAAPLTVTVIDLGEQPLANSYLDPSDAGPERAYPLHARFCGMCGLVQVDDVVPAGHIFEDYAYFSSYSDSWVDHAHRFAEEAIERLHLSASDLVVEVASNDGYLLQWFDKSDIRVHGVEPAKNVAEAAIARGIPTTTSFFGVAAAQALRQKQGTASLIAANNVLAHVPDLNDFIAGFAHLLAPDGWITVEFPHLLNLVRHTQFDTIYHEHYSYFSLFAARSAFRRHGLEIVDVQELSTHGGSLRLWIRHAEAHLSVERSVNDILATEYRAHLDDASGYGEFATRASDCRNNLIAFLDEIISSGQRVAAYGAAAKGNTLLNFASISTERIPYVVDRSIHKQGTLLPGSRIPVLEPDHVAIDKPDYLLILPWNLGGEISAQMSHIRDWGGQFVTAVPSIEVF